MPSVSAPISTSGKLAVLVRTFDRDAANSRRLIHELLESGRQDFLQAAVELMKTPGESRAFQYLVSLLVSENMFLAVLCDPALSSAQMIAAARTAQRFDPTADIYIARRLADGLMDHEPRVSLKDAVRLLEVLDRISDGRHILASLLRLLRHPSPHLRSKAVKMIGRRSRSAQWVQGRMAETDTRVRANAIESLDGVDTPEAREVLLACVHDADNRVAGNALMVLYHLGDASILPEFFRIAQSESSRFRSTAAWVMGQSRDPRFSEALAHLMRDTDAGVRTRAFHSLGQIKSAVATIRKTAPWLVAATALELPQTAVRKIQLTIATEDGKFPPVVGTQVMLTEGTQRITSYRFTPRPAPETMSLMFVFPRVKFPAKVPWVQAAVSCGVWKRSSDLWGLKPYFPREEEGGTCEAEEITGLTADLDAARAALLRPSRRTECSGFWSAVVKAARPEKIGGRGKRHVIIFNRSETIEPPPEDAVAEILGGGFVQAISTVPCPVLEEFCNRVRGAFQVAENPEQITNSIRNCYLVLLARYEIVYTPLSAQCRDLKIRLQTESGWGESSIPLFS